jgi:hypothetical protein
VIRISGGVPVIRTQGFYLGITACGQLRPDMRVSAGIDRLVNCVSGRYASRAGALAARSFTPTKARSSAAMRGVDSADRIASNRT